MPTTGGGSGQGGRGGGGGGSPAPESDGREPNVVIPSLTVNASNSAPLQAPFITPISPVAGIRLSANGIINRWVQNNLWLWGVATRTHDTFTGFDFSVDANGTVIPWAGRFQYAGIPKLLHGFWNFLNLTAFKILITDDTGSERTVYDSTTAPTAGTYIDITNDTAAAAMSYTVGSTYRLRVQIQTTAGSSKTARCDLLAICTQNKDDDGNDLHYPGESGTQALNACTNADAPDVDEYTAISTGQVYEKNLAAVPTGSSVKFIGTTGPNGSFFMRGRDSTHKQTTLNISYKFQNGTATLKTYALGSGTVIDSFTLVSDGGVHSTAYALTPGSYSLNAFYRYTVESSSGAAAEVYYVTVGGTIPLTSAPQKFAHLDDIFGDSGSPKLKPIGGSGSTDNLAEIRNALHGSSALQGTNKDYGFQFLAPDQSLGTIYQGSGAGYTYQLGTECTRLHVWRFLVYVTATDASATLSVNGVTIASPPGTSGEVGTYDLGQNASLAYGQTYTLDGVVVAFEVVEG